MTRIKKPLPNDSLHDMSDFGLKDLINVYRDIVAKYAKDDPCSNECRARIDQIYQILGYRCALEYIEKYGD